MSEDYLNKPLSFESSGVPAPQGIFFKDQNNHLNVHDIVMQLFFANSDLVLEF